MLYLVEMLYCPHKFHIFIFDVNTQDLRNMVFFLILVLRQFFADILHINVKVISAFPCTKTETRVVG